MGEHENESKYIIFSAYWTVDFFFFSDTTLLNALGSLNIAS